MNFTETVTFGFLWFSMGGRSAHEARQSELGPRRYSSLLQTVYGRSVVFNIVPIGGALRHHGRSVERAGTIHYTVKNLKKFSCLK
jgi:hypothetical protein